VTRATDFIPHTPFTPMLQTGIIKLYIYIFIHQKQGWQFFARRWKKPVFFHGKNRTVKILFAGRQKYFLPAKIGFCRKNRFMPELSSK